MRFSILFLVITTAAVLAPLVNAAETGLREGETSAKRELAKLEQSFAGSFEEVYASFNPEEQRRKLSDCNVLWQNCLSNVCGRYLDWYNDGNYSFLSVYLSCLRFCLEGVNKRPECQEEDDCGYMCSF